MISKAKIKLVNSLKLSKYRKQENLFVAEGSINVLDFIDGNLELVEIFAIKSWVEKYKPKLKRLEISEIGEKDMQKISNLKNSSEVLAIFKLPPTNTNIELDSFTLMLDDIHDPGNLGTIIRTADWFGVKNIICSNNTVDVFNPKVVQATMGSLARLNINYFDLDSFFAQLDSDIDIYGAVLDGKDIGNYTDPGNSILIIGSEAHGISPDIKKYINKPLTIPKASRGGAESLNAAIATSIILYHFLG